MTRSQAMVCAGLSPQAASASVRASMARAQGCPRWACSLLVTGRSRAITLCIASQSVSQPDHAVLKEEVYVHCPGGGPALGRLAPAQRPQPCNHPVWRHEACQRIVMRSLLQDTPCKAAPCDRH